MPKFDLAKIKKFLSASRKVIKAFEEAIAFPIDVKKHFCFLEEGYTKGFYEDIALMISSDIKRV